MPHKRKPVRTKIRDLLLNQTLAGPRVFENRTRKWGENEMPAICVYTDKESIEIHSHSPREYLRKLSITIECVHVLAKNVDDVLDTISDQVEVLLRQDDTLGGLVGSFELQESESAVVGESMKELGAVRLFYEAEYLSDESPNAIGDALEEIRASFDLAPKDGQLEATDIINLSQN